MKITKRQREYLDAISEFVAANGYNPTQTDLARHLGVHRNTVYETVKNMRREGILTDRRGSRGIELPDEPPGAPRASLG